MRQLEPVVNNDCYEDFCANIIPTDGNEYFCHNKTLGPSPGNYPTEFPLSELFESYDPFGGLCPAAFLTQWTTWNPTSKMPSYNYPLFPGFQNDTSNHSIAGTQKLAVGMLVDRFGSEISSSGAFLAPVGAPYSQRSIPPSSLNTFDPAFPYNYHVYKVEQEFDVQSGPIAAAFGQAGQGTQYYSTMNVSILLQKQLLVRVDLSE